MRRQRHRSTCPPELDLRSSSKVIWGALIRVVTTALRRRGVGDALWPLEVSGIQFPGHCSGRASEACEVRPPENGYLQLRWPYGSFPPAVPYTQ